MSAFPTAQPWLKISSARDLMLLALGLQLITMPFKYERGVGPAAYVSSSRASDREIYRQTGSRALANDSDYGRSWHVTANPAAASRTGLQRAPFALLILPVLLLVFWRWAPQGGFWQRRRGYLLALLGMLLCGGTIATVAGLLGLVAVCLGIAAVVWRFRGATGGAAAFADSGRVTVCADVRRLKAVRGETTFATGA